ncbi:BrnT family toxin [Desmonostoc muscorum LEGE 12446]|uniref:BrnT family toxin n=1 Tax=Desmonostoc muscorum LEGE 12446 TaxID=1828758 RepID=A0A8J6ZIX0_DESMC|nr:BrnT family toxin [Desmonostoc muscorum]MCF2150936.1 BrnT family toxin [Desmonostoc muscorum LEGE 12446]
MKFEWDQQKNQANIAKHGLDFADTPRVFNLPLRISLDERQDYGKEYVTIQAGIGRGERDAPIT